MSLCSFGCAKGVVGFTAVSGFVEVRPEGGQGHPVSLYSLRYALGVVRFVRCHWSAQCRLSGSSIVEVRPGGRGVRPGTLGSLVCALGFVWFIMCSWDH